MKIFKFLLNNLGIKQSGNVIWFVSVIFLKKLLSKIIKKYGLETSSRLFCISKDLVNFLKQTDYTGYVIAKLSKDVKISMLTFADSFYRRFFKNIKWLGTIG